VNSSVREGEAVPASYKTPALLLIHDSLKSVSSYVIMSNHGPI